MHVVYNGPFSALCLGSASQPKHEKRQNVNVFMSVFRWYDTIIVWFSRTNSYSTERDYYCIIWFKYTHKCVYKSYQCLLSKYQLCFKLLQLRWRYKVMHHMHGSQVVQWKISMSVLALLLISMSHLINRIRYGWEEWHIRYIRPFQQYMIRPYNWYITVIDWIFLSYVYVCVCVRACARARVCVYRVNARIRIWAICELWTVWIKWWCLIMQVECSGEWTAISCEEGMLFCWKEGTTSGLEQENIFSTKVVGCAGREIIAEQQP